MPKQSVQNPRGQTGAIDYGQRVLLNEAAKAGDATAMPMPAGNAASVPVPASPKVPTVSDYPEPPRDVVADHK